MDAPARSLSCLTALRFAAALLVLLFHADLLYGLPAAFGPVAAGYVGVSFFFVLSGFLLTWSRRRTDGPGAFYWRRFARIWPLHALVTVLAVMLGLAAEGYVGSLPSNLLLLTGMEQSINPPSWSLATEAFFYAAFPLLAVWIGRRRRLRLVALACILSGFALGAAADAVLGTELQWSYRLPLVRLGEFVLGMTLATAMLRGWRPPPLRVALGATAGMYLALWLLGDAAPMYSGSYLLALPLALLIAAAAARELRTGVQAPAWAVALGRWSFAVYLLHWPVLLAVGRLELGAVAATGITLVASTALAAAFYAGFERPVERRLRALPRAAARRTGAPIPAELRAG